MFSLLLSPHCFLLHRLFRLVVVLGLFVLFGVEGGSHGTASFSSSSSSSFSTVQTATCPMKTWRSTSQHYLTSAAVPSAVKSNDSICCLDEDNRMTQLSLICELTAILHDIIRRVHWSNVVFAFDYHNVHYQQAIVDTLSTLYVGAVYVPVVAESEAGEGGGGGGLGRVGPVVNLTRLVTVLTTTSYATSATPSARREVILCVTPQLLGTVLEQALSLGLLSADYQWLVLCPGGQSSLTHLVNSKLVSDPSSNVLMLLWSDQGQGAATTPLCSDRPLEDDFNTSSSANATTATRITPPCNGTYLNLVTYKSRPLHHFSAIDTWLFGQGWVKALPGQLFSNVFVGFENRLLTIGTIVAAPFVHREKIGNRTEYTGFCIDMLRTMATTLNFRYNIIESPDNKYGAPEADDRWNGMVGMVQRGEADMGVGPYTITSIRETVVDFSVPYMEDGGGILTRKGGSGTHYLAGLETFSKAIWLSLMATVLCVSLGLYLVVRFSPFSGEAAGGEIGCGGGRKGGDCQSQHQPHSEREGQMMKKEEKEKKKKSGLDSSSGDWHLGACLLHICGSLMQQGMEQHPKNASARCLLGFWWVFSILIISTFTATLASMLTVDVEGFQVDSIDDLLISSYKPLVLTGSVWETLFTTAKEGVYSEVAQRMNDMPEVTSEDEALGHVMSGEMAFLHDVNGVSYMYTVNCKQLHLAASIFNSNGYGIIMRENAPFKDAVNNLILRLQEGGFLEKWRTVWWPRTNDCDRSGATSVSQAEQLGIPKMAGLLFVYGSVIVVSTFLFFLSICLDKTGLGGRLEKAWGSLWFESQGKVHDNNPHPPAIGNGTVAT